MNNKKKTIILIVLFIVLMAGASVLYNNLSKLEYKRIVENYTLPKMDLKDYIDISCS